MHDLCKTKKDIKQFTKILIFWEDMVNVKKAVEKQSKSLKLLL
jgi:hypothetical protein